MRWVRFETEDGVRLGFERGDELVEALEVAGRPVGGPDPLLELLRTGVPLAGSPVREGASHERSAVRPLAPIGVPGKVIAIGLNYRDHADEASLALPAAPLVFGKFPSSIVGDGADIVVRAALTTQVDWEAELAFVVGRECGPDRAGSLDDIAGWMVANDVSARDLQFGDGQWTRGKSLDTFCPLGPALVTPDEVPDPGSLMVSTRVNGAVMQSASTEDLIFDLPTLIAFLSANFTLQPGDIVLTGTPPGVGAFREPPIFLADGDVVEVAVESIGALRNTVRFV